MLWRPRHRPLRQVALVLESCWPSLNAWAFAKRTRSKRGTFRQRERRRLVLALVEIKAIGRLAVFSAYFWTDKNLFFAGNMALLEAIVIWTQRLGLPWVVAADWQNLPQDLESSPWHKEAVAIVLAWQGPGGTCRARASERVIDFFWASRTLTGMLEGPFHEPGDPACASQAHLDQSQEQLGGLQGQGALHSKAVPCGEALRLHGPSTRLSQEGEHSGQPSGS